MKMKSIFIMGFIMADTTVFLDINSTDCAKNDAYSSARCVLQNIAAEVGECAVPKLVSAKDLRHQTSIYINWDDEQELTTIIFGIKGSSLPSAAYGNHKELAEYMRCIKKEAEKADKRVFLASTLKFIDRLSLALIITPGGLLSKLCTKVLPKLAVKMSKFIYKYAITRAVAYFTSSNFAKASLMAGTHVLNNGARSFEPDASILKTWFEGDKALVTVPLSATLIAGIGYLAKRYAWTETALNTFFAISAGLHHKERTELNAQLASRSKKKGDSPLSEGGLSPFSTEDKLRTYAFDASLFLLFSGTAASINKTRWLGTAACAVDDLLPAAVKALKSEGTP